MSENPDRTRMIQIRHAISTRTRRAVCEPMVVVPPSLWPERNQFAVYTDSEVYLVSASPWCCTCADYEYREPDAGCKHIRRVRIATGVLAAPESLRPTSDPSLGRLCSPGPRWESDPKQDTPRAIAREDDGGRP